MVSAQMKEVVIPNCCSNAASDGFRTFSVESGSRMEHGRGFIERALPSLV